MSEPKLRIRRGGATDAYAVVDLVGMILGNHDRSRIAAMCRKRGADILVADRDGVTVVVACSLADTQFALEFEQYRDRDRQALAFTRQGLPP